MTNASKVTTTASKKSSTTPTTTTTTDATSIDVVFFLKSISEIKSLKSELKSNDDTMKILIIVVAILAAVVILLVIGMCVLYGKYKKVEALTYSMKAGGDISMSSVTTSAVKKNPADAK